MISVVAVEAVEIENRSSCKNILDGLSRPDSSSHGVEVGLHVSGDVQVEVEV